MQSNQSSLSRVRVTIEVISKEQYEKEEAEKEAAWRNNLEIPNDDSIQRWDVMMPLGANGLVNFEDEVEDICVQYHNTKWYRDNT